jgi:hypothetical protein
MDDAEVAIDVLRHPLHGWVVLLVLDKDDAPNLMLTPTEAAALAGGLEAAAITAAARDHRDRVES